jgi:hypothetical protein
MCHDLGNITRTNRPPWRRQSREETVMQIPFARFPTEEPPRNPGRRSAIAGIGAGALAALLGGCVGATLAPRALDTERAPRVGASWIYGYRSGWSQIAPRTLVYTVTVVNGQGVQDRLTQQGDPNSGGERLFTSIWEIASRPLTNLMVHEFSPYLLAFGDVPTGERVSVSMPPVEWGTTWTTTARAVGSESVSVPAGTFNALRVEILGTRLFLGGQMDPAAAAVRLYATAWLAPAVKRTVRFTFQTQAAQLNLLARDYYELQSFKA